MLRQWSTWPFLLACLYPPTFIPHLPYVNLDTFSVLCRLWDTNPLSFSVGITEINCFAITRCSAFGFCQQWGAKQTWSIWDPQSQVLLHPRASVTSSLVWWCINPLGLPQEKDFVKYHDGSPSPRTYFQKCMKIRCLDLISCCRAYCKDEPKIKLWSRPSVAYRSLHARCPDCNCNTAFLGVPSLRSSCHWGKGRSLWT